jgi:hypothetical protein
MTAPRGDDMASKRRNRAPRPAAFTAESFPPDVDRLAMMEASRVYVCEQHGMKAGSNVQFIEVYKYFFDGIKASLAGRYLVFGNQEEFNVALIDMNNYDNGNFTLIYPDPKRGEGADATIGVYASVPAMKPARN